MSRYPPLTEVRALDRDALVTPLAPPLGRRGDLAPVVSAPFIRQRLDAISVG